nr:MAG TPA: hypothetical protein [Caudoviricetes sp.]
MPAKPRTVLYVQYPFWWCYKAYSGDSREMRSRLDMPKMCRKDCGVA